MSELDNLCFMKRLPNLKLKLTEALTKQGP